MIPMPETYLPYADIRRCGLQVTFEMVDVDAAETAEAAVSDACEMAQITQTHDRTEHPSCRYASLEQDYWRLDGSFLLPEQENCPRSKPGGGAIGSPGRTVFLIHRPSFAFPGMRINPVRASLSASIPLENSMSPVFAFAPMTQTVFF